MTKTVLISAPYLQPVIDRFRPLFEAKGVEIILPEVRERLSEAELMGYAGKIDGAIAGDDKWSAAVLEKMAPRMKVLSKWGTGIDSFDQAACARLGIAVRNVPNAFSEPVADSVFGYMLGFARRVVDQTLHMRAGHWEKLPGCSLVECTLGIIGVGNCGTAVARRAAGFGMTILGCDPRPIGEQARATGITMVSLDELLRKADFISLNCDLNPTSEKLINAETLRRVKPTAVLINTARGPIIDEKAMVAALQEERLAGVGLDVYEDEPLPLDSPLRRLPNVLAAAHNANSSPLAWDRVHQKAIAQCLEVIAP